MVASTLAAKPSTLPGLGGMRWRDLVRFFKRCFCCMFAWRPARAVPRRSRKEAHNPDVRLVVHFSRCYNSRLGEKRARASRTEPTCMSRELQPVHGPYACTPSKAKNERSRLPEAIVFVKTSVRAG